MNPTQIAQLRTALLADTDPEVVASVAARNDTETARLYNLPGTFIVYKSSVPTSDIGKTINYVAFEAMTDLSRSKLDGFTSLNPISFPPSKADIRAFFANIFSGALGGEGQATRDALEALWRRPLTKAEKACEASGTGTAATPGAVGTFEGAISVADVGRALNG